MPQNRGPGGHTVFEETPAEDQRAGFLRQFFTKKIVLSGRLLTFLMIFLHFLLVSNSSHNLFCFYCKFSTFLDFLNFSYFSNCILTMFQTVFLSENFLQFSLTHVG